MTRRNSFWHKTVWRLARTPAIKLIKSAYRLGAQGELKRRRELAASVVSDTQAKAMASQLDSHGFCDITALVDPALLQAVGDAGEHKRLRADQASATQHVQHKDFWLRLLDEDKSDGTLPTDNPFVAFAIQPAVLSVLARAYGEIPFLDDVLLTLSRPTTKTLSLSQLWHRDYDDTRTIKMFIYLTDVNDRDDGPFTFLDGQVSDRLGASLRSRRSDAEVDAKLRAGELREMIAPRLSVFMVETSRCLHMGSRVSQGHERLLYTASYISTPRLYPEPPARFRRTGNESDVVRCLLTPAGASQ